MSDAVRNNELEPWQSVFTHEEREIYRLYRRPDRPEFPWATAGLLVIDVTEEFVGADVPTIEAARKVRTACGAPAWAAVGQIKDLLTAFRDARRPILYTKGYSGERYGGAAVGRANPHATNRILPDIAPMNGDIVIEKPRASAFFGTPLTSLLIRHGVRGLVVVGGSTSGCVRASSLDASSLGFSVVIAHDGCFDRSVLSHSVALFELEVKYATVMSSRQVVDCLGEQGAPRPS